MHGQFLPLRREGDWWGILNFSIQHGTHGFRIYLGPSLGPSRGLHHCCQSCCEASGHREGWRPGLQAHRRWYLIEAGRMCGCGCGQRKGRQQHRREVHPGQANLKHWIGGPPGMLPFLSGLLPVSPCWDHHYAQSHPTSQPRAHLHRGSAKHACTLRRQARRLVVSLLRRQKGQESGFCRSSLLVLESETLLVLDAPFRSTCHCGAHIQARPRGQSRHCPCSCTGHKRRRVPRIFGWQWLN